MGVFVRPRIVVIYAQMHVLCSLLLLAAAVSGGIPSPSEKRSDVNVLLDEQRQQGIVRKTAAEIQDHLTSRLLAYEVDGLVTDAFRDETHADYIFLTVVGSGGNFNATIDLFYCSDTNVERRLKALVGAEVSIYGILDPSIEIKRPFRGPTLQFGRLSDIRIRTPAPADPFDVPELGRMTYRPPGTVSSTGRRRKSGLVLASWDNEFLMEIYDPRYLFNHVRYMRIELAEQTPPPVGTYVTAVGFTETDLSHINFSRARWKFADRPIPEIVPNLPIDLHLQEPFTNGTSRIKINPLLHGAPLRVSGTVQSIYHDTPRMILQCGNELVTVIFPEERRHDLELGATAEVTGICIVDIDNWRPNAVFPRMNGFFLVARGADDIRVLKNPPWWTPGRMLVVIGVLFGVIFAVLIWNASLRVLANRRGRQLLREQLGKAKMAFKVEERTRLAVELHDSIAQNLTGVAFQINAASRTGVANPDKLQQHLDVASKTLTSCREELRQCLWDLRSRALEESDFNQAIRMTVAQHIGEARLSVRFNVARAKLSDDSAHTVLRIVRELASNAVRHGHATAVTVAGCLDGETLRFSVADNGTGFTPESAPGTAQGHFGLQGVRERLLSIRGQMTIDSQPGKGARIEVSLTVPKQEKPCPTT